MTAIAAGDSTGALRGKVINEKGKELCSAKVVIDSAGKSTDMKAITDPAGNFEILDIHPGIYEFRVSFSHLHMKYTDVRISADKATIQTIVMHPYRKAKPAYYGPRKP